MRDIAVLLTNKPTDYMDRPLVFEEAVEELNKTARLDFRRSLVFGLLSRTAAGDRAYKTVRSVG